MIELPEQNQPEYIGDGVYIGFDGWQIWLQAAENRIALEPEVYRALRAWISRYPKLREHMG